MFSYCLRVCISILLSLFCIVIVAKSDNESDDNLLTLGLHFMEMEQYDKALTAFEEIRRQEPSSGIYCYIGMVYQEQNRLSDAVGAYKEALDFQAPSQIHGSAHLHLGIIYKAQG
ncbi:tetratricopeptide repeat protein, partial [Candidatus Poribacteria bacterium]|nr:tetratricopeptide repeat protein [Candidatus Poribacteria bacterium]